MRPTGYTPGDWLAACWRCGATKLASSMRRHWQGYYVCPEHWEPRHPQEFVRGVPDNQTVPWTQIPVDTYEGVCTINGRSSIPGFAIPGCSIPGNTYIDLDSIPVYTPNACNFFTRQGVPGWGIPGCSLPGFDPFVS